MTREIVKKIVKGITDKIECNTVDIDDWAEFWGFTRKEYEEFLDIAIKVLSGSENSNECGEWLDGPCGNCVCSVCKHEFDYDIANMRGFNFALPKYCPNCGAKMKEEE